MSSKPKATLLKPGKEFKGYSDFCKNENLTPVTESDFYRGAYYLALRGIISGFNTDSIASYFFGDTTLLLCNVGEEGLVLSLFKTKELDNFDENNDKEENSPIEHLG